MKKFITIMLLFIPLLLICSCQEKLTKKQITIDSFNYKFEQGLSSYTIIIIPEEDIDSLSISLMLKDKNKEIIYQDTINKSNLIAKQTYRYKFEYDFISSLEGNSISWDYQGYKSFITTETILSCAETYDAQSIGMLMLIIIFVIGPFILAAKASKKEKKKELENKISELEKKINNIESTEK